MKSRSTSLPSEHPAAPLSPTPPGRSEMENSLSMEDRGVMEDIGAQVIITLRRATYKLLRFHIHDWLALIVLAAADIVLNIISPFYRYVGQTMITDYIYPLKPNSVPLLAVPVIAVVIPLVIFLIYFIYTRDITDLHHAILGLFYSVLITAVITDSIKNAVGRPRPDFFWRCFPDGVGRYNNVTLDVICHGDAAEIKEGHKSFPSGHTSWCFAGLGFLSLYLAGKLQLFNRRGHVGKLIIVIIPLLGALLVGLSRVRDYWHHWSDVFAGALIGLIVSALCYHHLFPSVFSDLSTGPHSYLQLGNSFRLGWFSWLPHRRQHSDWPPAGNSSHDLELGRNSNIP